MAVAGQGYSFSVIPSDFRVSQKPMAERQPMASATMVDGKGRNSSELPRQPAIPNTRKAKKPINANSPYHPC